ncbi:MAG: ATP synthase subunit I, partial [Desulfobacterales bacterium]
ETEKKYCSRAMSVAIIGGLIFILADQRPIGKGLILGSIFSVINFVVMGEMLPWKMGKSKKKTVVVSFGSIFSRYLLLAIPLVVAIRLSQIHLISTVVGIFLVQLMILTDHLWGYRSTMRKN